VHVAPACAGSDHAGSYVLSLSLHFCRRPLKALIKKKTLVGIQFCCLDVKSNGLKVNIIINKSCFYKDMIALVTSFKCNALSSYRIILI
jgi:hypothetical protein